MPAPKPLLVIKAGSTYAGLAQRHGDFEHWIMKGFAAGSRSAVVADIQAGDALPMPQLFAGVVVSGSHAMLTDRAEWMTRAAHWLAAAVRGGLPVLGICFGHQLLAEALGGTVGDNPRGSEFGSILLQLAAAAEQDALFRSFPTEIFVQACHRQSVLALPPEAELLAASDIDPHQAFRFGDRAWGVQFHPEFCAATAREYVSRSGKGLAAEGKDPAGLFLRCHDTPWGLTILQRFSAFIEGHERIVKRQIITGSCAPVCLFSSGDDAVAGLPAPECPLGSRNIPQSAQTPSTNNLEECPTLSPGPLILPETLQPGRD